MTLSVFNTEIFRHFGRMFSRILSKERWIEWMGNLSKEMWMGILPNLDLSLSGGVMFVDRGTRRDAGRNPDTPPEDLAFLSKDADDSMVRWYVARNPSTPPDTLLSMRLDWNRGVREEVIKNDSTPYGTWVGMVRVF